MTPIAQKRQLKAKFFPIAKDKESQMQSTNKKTLYQTLAGGTFQRNQRQVGLAYTYLARSHISR
jgi:hypothetical protein